MSNNSIDFEIYPKYFFATDKKGVIHLLNLLKDGWRLPTIEEFNKISWNQIFKNHHVVTDQATFWVKEEQNKQKINIDLVKIKKNNSKKEFQNYFKFVTHAVLLPVRDKGVHEQSLTEIKKQIDNIDRLNNELSLNIPKKDYFFNQNMTVVKNKNEYSQEEINDAILFLNFKKIKAKKDGSGIQIKVKGLVITYDFEITNEKNNTGKWLATVEDRSTTNHYSMSLEEFIKEAYYITNLKSKMEYGGYMADGGEMAKRRSIGSMKDLKLYSKEAYDSLIQLWAGLSRGLTSTAQRNLSKDMGYRFMLFTDGNNIEFKDTHSGDEFLWDGESWKRDNMASGWYMADGGMMAKGGKIEKALYNIDKWMPEDFELQREYYQLINDKDQKGMEEFLDMYADQDRLMRYGIQYEDLGKLAEAIISGSNYAKGGATSDIYVLGSNYEIRRPMNVDDDDLAKALKKHKVEMYFIDEEGYGDAFIKLIGEKDNIENLLKDFNVWNIDPNELDDLYLKMKKYKGKLDPTYNASKYMKQYYKDLYSDEDYADGGETMDPGVYPANFFDGPNPTNLYALMELDIDTGYGSLVDGRIYTINEAFTLADELNENIDNYDKKIEAFTVEQLLKRKSLPKSSKDQIYENYKDKKNLINSLIERFGKMDWQKEFKYGGYMAKGGTTKKSDPPQTATEFFEWYSRGYAGWYNDPTILMFMKINGKEIPSRVQNSYPRNQKLKDILAFFKANRNAPIKNYKEELDDYDYYTISFDLKDKKITMEENGNKFSRGFGRYGKNLAYSESYADGGDTDEPNDEMEKLVSEHYKEAKRNRVKITNFGWSQGDDYIVSKTTERKDGSDVLTSEIDDGVVEHDWDSYARGGKLKSNPAKFRDKVKAISKKLAGTKVPKKYKKDYGATYDKQEATTAARRISGAKLAELRAKLAKKTKSKKK